MMVCLTVLYTWIEMFVCPSVYLFSYMKEAI